jgi:hypothetical protein
MEFRIYVLIKPAERACRIGGLIEEWSTVDGSERLVLSRMFERVGHEIAEILPS